MPFLRESIWPCFFWLALAAFFLLPRIAHLYPDALPGINEGFTATFWPVLLIVVGAGVILKILVRKKSLLPSSWSYTTAFEC
ncbi:MAG TPA: hypothetical protein DDZ57_07865 [Porphyromonadaceae bacterium]|nr:hypothetical protein [Porphyromonadaceae bacterium]